MLVHHVKAARNLANSSNLPVGNSSSGFVLGPLSNGDFKNILLTLTLTLIISTQFDFSLTTVSPSAIN